MYKKIIIVLMFLFIMCLFSIRYLIDSKYVIKNTYANDYDFIRSRLGFTIEEQNKKENSENQNQNQNQKEKEDDITIIKKQIKIMNVNRKGGNIDELEKELERAKYPIDTEVPNEHDSIDKKKGWCYVGTDRGYRSCIMVGENESCLSQNIYPSKGKCIHPSLRF